MTTIWVPDHKTHTIIWVPDHEIHTIIINLIITVNISALVCNRICFLTHESVSPLAVRNFYVTLKIVLTWQRRMFYWYPLHLVNEFCLKRLLNNKAHTYPARVVLTNPNTHAHTHTHNLLCYYNGEKTKMVTYCMINYKLTCFFIHIQ
jgi:hypothetical protein